MRAAASLRDATSLRDSQQMLQQQQVSCSVLERLGDGSLKAIQTAAVAAGGPRLSPVQSERDRGSKPPAETRWMHLLKAPLSIGKLSDK